MSSGLHIQGLQVSIGAGTPLRACSLQVRPGEVLGLVGESGSGKSLTALACLGLLPPRARASGSIRIGDTELLGAPEPALRAVRGRRVAMIFQNPLSALNPFYTVGRQLLTVVTTHFKEPRTALKHRVSQALQKVQLGDAYLQRYPHQLSGGQLQRVMIAMAVACEPEVLIADEPTTALDVTVQARIMRLLRELSDQGMGLLLISHDLDLVAQMADRVSVMYGGRTVEHGPVRELMASASHPYTASLLKAQPRLGELQRRLPVIDGQVLPSTAVVSGCVFVERCRRAVPACTGQLPPTVSLRAASHVECHNPILPATLAAPSTGVAHG
ncbi:ABC transporter ATP-binding protein [Paucibacter sp. JuS9]|uniref:ABC transporter ATP-binding protein n=1 Tax=Roseateles TaxID=93681 RepID=UPI002FE5F728